MGTFFSRIKENKVLLVSFIAIITIILVTEIFIVFYLKYEIKQEKDIEKDLVINEEKIIEEPTQIMVEIKGEVVTPGIYEVEQGKRIIDIIKYAGGLTEFADTRVNNLSKKVEDEMVIIVYSKDQIANFLAVKEEEKKLNEQCNQDSLTDNNSCLVVENNVEGLININTATVDEIKNLPGIGDAKANDIINYRNENGLFLTIEDIKKVSGIGDSIYDQIKDLITTE